MLFVAEGLCINEWGYPLETIGKPLDNGGLIGFYGVYPVVICYITIEHHHFYITIEHHHF